MIAPPMGLTNTAFRRREGHTTVPQNILGYETVGVPVSTSRGRRDCYQHSGKQGRGKNRQQERYKVGLADGLFLLSSQLSPDDFLLYCLFAELATN